VQHRTDVRDRVRVPLVLRWSASYVGALWRLLGVLLVLRNGSLLHYVSDTLYSFAYDLSNRADTASRKEGACFLLSLPAKLERQCAETRHMRSMFLQILIEVALRPIGALTILNRGWWVPVTDPL
jgi:hypothetical protein